MNCRLKERLHHTQLQLTFLTFSSEHCSFKLLLPNNESDRSFLKGIHACVQFQPCRCKTHQTWKGKRKPQTCYWIRPSQTAQSQGCLFAFFSTPIFKKFLGPYCSFRLLPKMPWRTEISATKSFNHVRFVFDSSGNWSDQRSTNFRETLLLTASLVLCQLDSRFFPRSKSTVNSPRSQKFDRGVALSDFWMNIFARFMALLTSCRPDKIQNIPSQKCQCYKRNSESAAVQLSSYICTWEVC